MWYVFKDLFPGNHVTAAQGLQWSPSPLPPAPLVTFTEFSLT